MTLNDVYQQVYHTTDTHGNSVVQIPLEVWNAYIRETTSAPLELEEIPCDEEINGCWWLEFERFLNDNQVGSSR